MSQPLRDQERQRPWDAGVAVPLPPEAGFAPHEHWAWTRIIRGERADMRFFPKDEAARAADANGEDDGKGDDPNKSADWPAHRDLSARFMHTILFHERWANARARPFVRIASARFSEELDWENETFEDELELGKCLFAKELKWSSLRVGHNLGAEGSRFADKFCGDNLDVGGSFYLRKATFAHELSLIGAHTRADVSFSGAQLEGVLRADRLVVDGGLFCREGLSAKGDIRLPGARVRGNAEFNGAKLEGVLSADGLAVDGSLFCREGFTAKGDIRLLGARVRGNAEFDGARLEGAFKADRMVVGGSLFCGEGFSAKGETQLRGAHVNGNVSFNRAKLEGTLRADGVLIDGACFFRRMEKLSAANLLGAHIGGNLHLSRSTIEGRIDLTGAEIKGELNLMQSEGGGPTWGAEAHLILRNAKAGALAGGIGAFRSGKKFVRCELAGFTYDRIGGLGAGEAGSTLASAKGHELRAWLNACRAQDHFDPAPYRALAKALDDVGRADRAADVRNALGNYELVAKGTPWTQRLMLRLSWLFIGYGERNHRAFVVFALLVLAAAGTGYWQDLVWLPAATPAGWADWQAWRDWIGYAFGDAVPLLSFDEAHKTFLADRFSGHGVPTGLTAFFYTVKIAGFVILSYLAAGLSGLAQRRG